MEGEEEEDEEDDDEEEEEEEDPVTLFDARKAHETFIWRALQGGVGKEEEEEEEEEEARRQVQLLALSQSLSKKTLKWADEVDGGELNNVQYFDKNAEPSQGLFSTPPTHPSTHLPPILPSTYQPTICTIHSPTHPSTHLYI